MAESHTLSSEPINQQEIIKESFAKYGELVVSTFPRNNHFSTNLPLQATFFQHNEHKWFALYQLMVNALVIQEHFVCRTTDVFVASLPKTGTTWLKGLVSSISTRGNKEQQYQVNTLHPHKNIPFLEFQVYASEDQILDIDSLPSPRLLSTHIPYPSLPASLMNSRCKIVYIWRDPKATFVSEWHFYNKIIAKEGRAPIPINEKFDLFCNGFSMFGPYWDHVLGYWNAKKNGANILFLKYEDMLEDPIFHVKSLAEFMGVPFTEQEEKEGVLQEIITACSFEKMKDYSVNMSENAQMLHVNFDYSFYFRNGKKDDWANHLTPEMAKRMDTITMERFANTDLIP